MTTLDSIRAKSEADFIDKLKTLGERHRRKLIAARKRYGSVKAIPDSVWIEIAKDTEAETTALLLLIFIAGYVFTLDSLPGLRRRDGMPTDEAKRFATRRGKAFGEGYAETTRKRWEELETAIDDLGKDQTQKARLEATERGLGEILSTGRAEGAGITETTGGLSAGQRQAGDDGRAFNPGVTVTLFWRTEKDEKVCPVCKPLDGKSEAYCESIGIGQPAHPRCRCEWVAKIEAGVSESLEPKDGDGDGLIDDGKPTERPAPIKPKVNPKVLEWAKRKFKDDRIAQNFAEWFGDSKVVDEKGEPLVVYHGTEHQGKIEEFKASRDGLLGPGVYLASESDYANRFAGKKGVVYPSYAISNNPKTFSSSDEYANAWQSMPNGSIYDMKLSLRNQLEGQGYDSIRVEQGNKNNPWYVFAVFDPNQIKSALSNSGAYSRASNKINESQWRTL